jgi:2-polyprenyl-3-methyl-5-hydroxy-6-metoxy-1,4-benzoquinol methylase
MVVHPKLVGRTCYHKYEIESGFVTPGTFLEIDPRRCLNDLGIAQDLTGARALDIGAWDGPFTFELERRGAAVTALDIQDPDVTVFNAVKAIKNSAASFVRGSVYEARPENLGQFDLVLFAGVYYHLKNPVLALQRIRRLLEDGGQLFIEGASSTEYLCQELTRTLGLSQAQARTAAEVVDRLPLAYFDIEQKIYQEWSNWWFPTTRGLEVIMIDSGFCDVRLELRANALYNHSHARLMGSATADPSKTDPAAQQHEHGISTSDFESNRLAESRFSGRFGWVPYGVRHAVRRVRRAIERF